MRKNKTNYSYRYRTKAPLSNDTSEMAGLGREIKREGWKFFFVCESLSQLFY